MLVSPQRATRPWQGQEDQPKPVPRVTHDPACYLCPGNARVGGERNPDYSDVFVFDNDFQALSAEESSDGAGDGDLFASQGVAGIARVICFSPDHGASLPDLTPVAMRAVVDAWCRESAVFGKTYHWVQVFENKGAMMGCSNPHPHGQIWATSYLPDEAALEDNCQRAYHKAHARALLGDVVERELAESVRVVVANAHWVVVVPFWASWPFETLVLPRFQVARLPDLKDAERDTLGDIVQRLTRAYDALFGVPFPYSMGWHGAPFDDRPREPWRLHAHFYPPLLRSASVRKFMVGFEMLAEAQRDLTPEQAAERLRAVAA